MRNPRPLKWIEEAEARQVLAAALHERPAPPAPLAADTGANWAIRVRRWIFAAGNPDLPQATEAVYSRGPRLVRLTGDGESE